MKYIKFVALILLFHFTTTSACRKPNCPEPEGFLPNSFDCKIQAKGISEFYVAILDSTVISSGNQINTLKQIEQEVEKWMTNGMPFVVSEAGDTSYIADSEDYRKSINKFDSLYILKCSVPDSIQLKNPETVKCKDTAAYKIFGGLDPYLWRRANNGEILLTDSIYLLNGYYKVVIYDPLADWYYVSPLTNERKITLNEDGEWEIHTNNKDYPTPQKTPFLKVLLFILCLLIIESIRISIPILYGGIRNRAKLRTIAFWSVATIIFPSILTSEVVFNCTGDAIVFYFIILAIILLLVCVFETMVFFHLLKTEDEKNSKNIPNYNIVSNKTLLRTTRTVKSLVISVTDAIITFLLLSTICFIL